MGPWKETAIAKSRKGYSATIVFPIAVGKQTISAAGPFAWSGRGCVSCEAAIAHCSVATAKTGARRPELLVDGAALISHKTIVVGRFEGGRFYQGAVGVLDCGLAPVLA